jgi:hypothetical protein
MRLLATAALTFLLASTAHAKGVIDAEACGASGCVPVEVRTDTMLGGPSAEPPAAAEPFVRLRVQLGHPGPSESILFLPGSELMRFETDPHGAWVHMDAAGPWLAAAERLEPFPAAQLPARFVAPPAAPQAPASAPADASGGTSAPWWLALAAVPLCLAVLLARRRGRPMTA